MHRITEHLLCVPVHIASNVPRTGEATGPDLAAPTKSRQVGLTNRRFESFSVIRVMVRHHDRF